MRDFIYVVEGTIFVAENCMNGHYADYNVDPFGTKDKVEWIRCAECDAMHYGSIRMAKHANPEANVVMLF